MPSPRTCRPDQAPRRRSPLTAPAVHGLPTGITDPTTRQVGEVLTIPGVIVTPQPTATATAGSDTPTANISLLQLVDKQHPLPSAYEPPDIVAVPGPYSAPGYSSTMNVNAL